MTLTSRLTSRPASCLCAAFSLAVLAATSAFAHGRLEMSTPANGARLAAAPSELKLLFSEPVEAAMTTVRLLGPGDGEVVVEKAHRDHEDVRSIVVGMPRLGAGDYRAQWATSGRDGHRVKGEIRFSVK